MRAILTAVLVAAPATAAYAHPGDHGHTAGIGGALISGFVHPLGGIDHVLVMVAVGVLAFTLGRRAMLTLPAAFVAAMAVGAVLGLGAISTGDFGTWPEIGIALSVAAAGAALMFGRGLPFAFAVAGCAAFAALHGYAHGAEMPAGLAASAYFAGFAGATVLLHLIGIALGGAAARLRGNGGLVATRVGGALTAVTGGVLMIAVI